MRHRVRGVDDDTVGKDGSAALPARSVVNFTGPGVTVTEDTGEVLVSVPDAGGGGGVIADQWVRYRNNSLDIPGDLVFGSTRVALTFHSEGPGGSDWVATTSVAPEQTNLAAGTVGVNDAGIYVVTLTVSTTRATAMTDAQIPSFAINYFVVNDSPTYNLDVYNQPDVMPLVVMDAGITNWYVAQMQYVVYAPTLQGAVFIARGAQGQSASPDTWDYNMLIQKVI
jgi:hypothetical protein